MSNFLNKGKRNVIIQQKKNGKEAVAKFQKTLLVMNEVFEKLSNDPELDDDNFESKVKEITKFKFSQKQLEILKKDLIVDLDDLLTEDIPQQQPANETQTDSQ